MMTSLRHTLQLTRRALVAGLLLPAAMARRASAARPLASPRQRSRAALQAVQHWGCQYQNVDIAAITRSDLDLIVLDPSLDDAAGRFITPEEMRALKIRGDGGRRLVLGYLSVGEVDTKRWYWPLSWGEAPPDWVGPANPAWPGARAVKYWNRDWQALVFAGRGSVLERIMEIGFDGVFLDRVDAYGDWGGEGPALDAMGDLVTALAAKARRRDPGFIVMLQNAEHILARADVVAAMDAHSKESLLTGLAGPDTLNSEEDVAWSLTHLRPLQQLGIPTFATEYISDSRLREEIRGRLLALGFKPFFGTRGLDRLPDAERHAQR